MDTRTILLIIAATIVALGVVLFQYYYKTKKRENLSISLSFLRFVALFGILLLLINPKFSRNVLTVEKPNLILLTDNSSSVKKERETIEKTLSSLEANKPISDNFNISKYSFGTSLNDSDSLTFDETNTNIGKALATLKDVYVNSNTAIVLLTDGNQTIGANYEFSGKNLNTPVYPIVLGDTTRYEDLQVAQVNSNKYAFLKNKFPLEIYLSYEGQNEVKATVNVSVDGRRVYREEIEFSNTQKSKVVNALLEAKSVGIKTVKVDITALPNELNKVNNLKTVIVEVIDEKTNVAIISDLSHPDIGTLTKAIESNEQRSVSVKKPIVNIKELEEIDLFILYQPNTSFYAIYKYIQQRNANVFTITGTHTDWNFLNNIQDRIRVQNGFPVQETFPVVNPAFSKFDISQASFEGYPPLASDAGDIQITGTNEALLGKQIMGVAMNDPLMAVFTKDNQKEAVFFGENFWKWRMQNYRDHQNFEQFDNFIGKLVFYLSDNKSKNRLNLDYKSIYEGNNDAKISATYFDESFVFDPNANISLKLKNETAAINREIPMLLKGNYYEVDLSTLPLGKYDFTVTVKDENQSKSGSFMIMDFDVEQQFLSSDHKKLALLSEYTQGALYFPSTIDSLIKNVTNNNRYRPIQSSRENVVPLIDFRILLAIIAAMLALEWLIRKYNGLI